MSAALATPITIEPMPGGWRGCFGAMASPCEVLVEDPSANLAQDLTGIAFDEAQRIEQRYSRYRSDSVIAQIHAARGEPQRVCDETARLLDHAAQCHVLSGGLFDITSGVLRRAWRFGSSEGRGGLPAPALVRRLLAQVGWPRVQWQRPWLTLPEGMELDFGGIGKEYAVDRVLALLRARTSAPLLVNFGGDLAVSGPRHGGVAWHVGVARPGPQQEAALALDLAGGALATSGDARRCIVVDGVRYGHVLDPRTGWPVRGAPRSVTVAAATCSEAGFMSTLALLQGAQALPWLQAQAVPHWVLD